MATVEEFQESEVIFSDVHCSNHYATTHDGGVTTAHDEGFIDRRRLLTKNGRSVPVNIPLHQGTSIVFNCGDRDGDNFDEDHEEIVPPHVIMGRRIAAKMAFSVCTGNGRTLKGRDLSQVRNSILRLTGFLEA